MAGVSIPALSSGWSKHVDFLLILTIVVNAVFAIILSIYGNLMYPFFIILYAWIASYVSLIAILIWRNRTTGNPLVKDGVRLGGVLLFAIVIRLLFIGETHDISLDALWYLDFGRFMHLGAMPYTGFYFPYPPVFAYIIYIIASVLPSVQGFRLFAILMDLAVLVVLWKLVKQEVGLKQASIVSIIYAFLPISIIESGWNGHFEPLVIFLILASLWFLTKQNCSVSGVFLGLSVATKIYPLVIFPILFTYIKDWKNRILFTGGFVLAEVLAHTPILILTRIANPGLTEQTQSVSSSGLFEMIFQYLSSISYPIGIIAIGLTLSIIIGVIHLMRQINKDDSSVNAKLYQSVTIAIGLVVIAVGLIAVLYPFLPISRMIYWRFPKDIAIVRGITTIGVGLLLTSKAYHDRITGTQRHVSRNSMLVLVGAAALIMVAMTQLFFYGWYLLWSIPFLLLLPEKRLSYTIILCLLLMYPNYTSDNFANLGFEEQRRWQDEFNDVDGWSSVVNIIGSDVNVSQVSAYIDSDGTTGEFWFDARNVTNDDDLTSVSISYIKVVNFSFDDTTEFVARIAASWDPPFGRYADLSLSIKGNDTEGEYIEGVMISKTSMFTNLTYIQWRYDFRSLASPPREGTITILNLI